jgi:hypothetical protein
MTEKPGHFEKGVWIEDLPPAPQETADPIDKRLSEATKGVITSINTVMNVTRELVTTDEGRQYIEKTMNDTQKQVQQTLDTIVSRAKAELEKNRKP